VRVPRGKYNKSQKGKVSLHCVKWLGEHSLQTHGEN